MTEVKVVMGIGEPIDMTVVEGTMGVVLVIELEDEELSTFENSEEVVFEDTMGFDPARGGCIWGCGGSCGCGCNCGSGRCIGVLALLFGTTRDVRFPSNVGRVWSGIGKLGQESAVELAVSTIRFRLLMATPSLGQLTIFDAQLSERAIPRQRSQEYRIKSTSGISTKPGCAILECFIVPDHLSLYLIDCEDAIYSLHILRCFEKHERHARRNRNFFTSRIQQSAAKDEGRRLLADCLDLASGIEKA